MNNARPTSVPGVLPALRRQIDRLDERMLRLLNARGRLAQQIGRIKHRKKWPVYDAKREAFVLRHVTQQNAGPLSPAAVRHVFQSVLTECRRRQRRRPRQRGRVS